MMWLAKILQRVLPLAVLLLVIVLGYLLQRYHWQTDLSLNRRNTVSEQSAELLRKMSGPVEITAYASGQDAKYGDLRLLISDFMRPWQRVKPDLTLRFVDPSRDVQAARAAGIQVNGEMIVRYQGRTQVLRQLSENALANALQRLARSGERVVMFMDTHGEPDLAGRANFDLGDFGQALVGKGFRLQPLNLALAQAVPVNVDVLVLTRPRVALLPGEVNKLLAYIERGGKLLWLLDPGSLNGLEPLAEQLSLHLPAGHVVDPAATELRAPESWAISAAYGDHPVLRDFRLLTVFPDARPLELLQGSGWQANALVTAAGNGWVEQDDARAARYDAQRDVPGPVTLAYALTRQAGEQEQRVVVVGNSGFLANMYLGNGGNLDLGVNLLNWVVGDDDLIAIQPKITRDAQLQLSRNEAGLLAGGLLFALPGSLLLMAAGVWWRRRRA